MDRMGSIVELQLQIYPSWLYVFLVTIVYGLTMICFIALFAHHASFLWCGPLVVMTLSLHFCILLRQALLLSGTSIQQLHKTQAGYCLLLVNGEQRVVQWTGKGFISAPLLIVEFWDGAEKFVLTLLPDALSREQHRRAKAHFLLHKPHVGTADSLAS